MNEKKFERVEKKYILSAEQYDDILSLFKKKLQKDSYFLSGVYNIYFDTEHFDLIVQSIDQPVFKEKLRARSYEGYDKVFFEIKTKLRGRVYDKILVEKGANHDNNIGAKRRVLITRKDYKDLMRGKADFVEVARRKAESKADEQIAREIDYLVRLFDLKPKIYVHYDRESYKGERGLRITFDKNLTYRTNRLEFKKNRKDKKYFQDNNVIMEIKALGAMPLWLAHELSARKIYPQQFSKIGSIYNKIRKEQNV